MHEGASSMEAPEITRCFKPTFMSNNIFFRDVPRVQYHEHPTNRRPILHKHPRSRSPGPSSTTHAALPLIESTAPSPPPVPVSGMHGRITKTRPDNHNDQPFTMRMADGEAVFTTPSSLNDQRKPIPNSTGDGPETTSCIKPSKVKGKGWPFGQNAQSSTEKKRPVRPTPCPPSPPLPPPPCTEPVSASYNNNNAGSMNDEDQCTNKAASKFDKQESAANVKDQGFPFVRYARVSHEEHVSAADSNLEAERASHMVVTKYVNSETDYMISKQHGHYIASQSTEVTPMRANILMANCPNEQDMQLAQIDKHRDQFSQTGEFLFQLYKHGQLTDVVVHCGPYTFSVHAITLACHSPYFCRALLENRTFVDNHRHVTLSPEVSPTTFNTLLDYMYTGELQIHPKNVADLLTAAVALGMEQVKNLCRAALDNLTPETVLVVWALAEKTGLQSVASKAIKILSQNFLGVVKSAQFLSLDCERLVQLLSHDELPGTSEYDIADAAISWLHYDEDNRRPNIARVMVCVRLPLMTSQELFSLINRAEFIFNDKDVQNMFMVANWFATSRQLDLPCKLRKQLPGRRDLMIKKEEHFQSEAKPTIDEKKVHPTKSVVFREPSTPQESDRSLCSEQSEDTIVTPTPITNSTITTNTSQKASISCLMLLGGYEPVAHEMDHRANATLTYNRDIGEWKPHDDMPEPRAHHVAAVLQDAIYVIGGNGPSTTGKKGHLVPKNVVHAYVIKKGRWCEKASLNTPRTRHGACVLGNKIFVVGGHNDKGVLYCAEYYDSERDVWCDIPPMLCARLGSGVAAYRGQIVVTGGYGQNDRGQNAILRSVESYDPSTEQWMMRAPLRTPRCHGSLVESGGILYLCGGLQPTLTAGHKSSTTSMGAIDSYYDITDTWSLIAELQVPRHQVAAIAMDGKLYIVGGMSTKTGTTSNIAECYDIASATWDANVMDLPSPLVGSGLVAVTQVC